MQDIDGLDVKLLFGCYQRKVLGYEEKIEVIPDILGKIILAKKAAKQLALTKVVEEPVLLPQPELAMEEL